MIGLGVGSFCSFCNLVFQIDWTWNRRKRIRGSGRWSSFPYGSSIIHVLEKYLVLYLKLWLGYCILFRCYNILVLFGSVVEYTRIIYEGWNFNSGNYLFTSDTK